MLAAMLVSPGEVTPLVESPQPLRSATRSVDADATANAATLPRRRPVCVIMEACKLIGGWTTYGATLSTNYRRHAFHFALYLMACRVLLSWDRFR